MTIEERLEKVERMLAAILGQESNTLPQSIRSSSFRLMDKNGKTRIFLDASTGVPGLYLLDANGRTIRASLSILDAIGPVLSLADESGNPRVMLNVPKDGRPRLTLYDQNYVVRAELCESDYGPRLAMFDETSKLRVELNASNTGPLLGLLNKNGMKGLVLEQSNNGLTGMGIYRENGEYRLGLHSTENYSNLILFYNKSSAALSTGDDPGPGLALRDEGGNLRTGLGVSTAGPVFSLYDENGRPIWSAP